MWSRLCRRVSPSSAPYGSPPQQRPVRVAVLKGTGRSQAQDVLDRMRWPQASFRPSASSSRC